MVFFLSVLLVTALAGTSVSANANPNLSSNPNFSNLLEQGIQDLEQGRLSNAQVKFRTIPFGSEEWPNKALALMRYHYAKKDYPEVWKIGQVLKRTGHQNLEQNLLSKSALYKYQSCILDVDSTLSSFDDLLAAATYRFQNRYSGQQFNFAKSFEAWDDGIHNTSLASSLNFYLTEIPKVKLQLGKGCSQLRFSLDDKLKAKKNEFRAIINFFENRNKLSSDFLIKRQAELMLLARAMELSKATTENEPWLNNELQKLNLVDLIDIPDVERRFLWAAREAVLPWPDSERLQFIKQTILKANDPATVDWLSQLDLEKVSIADRILLFEKLLAYDQLSDNNFLLLKLSQTYWSRQDTKKTLQTLRRLLIESRGQDDEATGLASLDLATQIFSELKWDQSVLGALQASLPRSLWLNLNIRLLKQAAYKGDRVRFEQILKRLSDNSIPEQQLGLLRSLVYRDLPGFKKLLINSGVKKRLSRHALNFLDDFAAAQFESTSNTIKNMNLFFSQIVTTLKEVLENPIEDGEHLQQLIYIFSQGNQDQWLQGNASVRRGIVKAGKVTLKESSLLVCPFKLMIPKNLPLRELIFKPVEIRSNQWVLE